jgi:uncharacterized protein
MSDNSMGYHEPVELLSEETQDMHRAVVSAMEELEAIDWYQQRAEACSDPELKAILLHNKDEEIEHAMMSLEWIRRRNAKFDQQARTYLFTEKPILEVEETDPGGGGHRGGHGGGDSGSLGIGSLRRAGGEEP